MEYFLYTRHLIERDSVLKSIEMFTTLLGLIV